MGMLQDLFILSSGSNWDFEMRSLLISFFNFNFCCSYLLEQLASEGYFIMCVPYNVTFDHEKVTREVFERFHACYDVICEYGLPDFGLSAEEVVDLPLYSVGHR